MNRNLSFVLTIFILTVFQFSIPLSFMNADNGEEVSLNTDWQLSESTMMPPSPKTGETVSFQATVSIVSLIDPLPQTVEVALYLGEDVYYSTSLTFTQPLEEIVVLTDWTATAGEHFVEWVVDPYFEYVDPEPENNFLGEHITVEKVGPNIKITSLDLSNLEPVDGEEITIIVEIVNTGDVTAEEFTIIFLIDGIQVHEEVTTLNPDESSHLTYPWTATLGDHTISVKAGEETEDTTVTVEEPELKYDLIARYLQPIQVVKTGYNYLVLEKNTVFEVGIYSSFPWTVYATIKLGFDNFDTQEYVTTLPLPFKPRNTTYYMLPLEDDLSMEYWLRFELRKAPKPIDKPAGVYVMVDSDTRIEELNETNNRFPSSGFTEFQVRDTAPLEILYRRTPIFSGDDQYLLDRTLESYAKISTEFILDTFPIADKSISFHVDWGWITRIRVTELDYQQNLLPYFPPNVSGLISRKDGIVSMDLNVAEQNGLLSASRNASSWVLYYILRPFSLTALRVGADNNQYNRIVLVTPPGWFGRHFHAEYITTAGLMFTDLLGAVFAEVGGYDTSAHEIGHTFNLRVVGPEEYDSASPRHGFDAHGFSVNKYMEIDTNCRHDLQLDHECYPGFCFMGAGRVGYKLIDGSIIPFSNDTNQVTWIGDVDYRRLQNNYNPFDPDLLLVDGIIFLNKSVFLNPFYRLPTSIVSLPFGTTGNYYVVLLNSEDQVLGQVGFNATFDLRVVQGNFSNSMDIDFQSFMFTMPWIDGTTHIQIRDEVGSVLASRVVSSNPPQVIVKTPNGGENLYTEETYSIEWTATDPDGDALTFTIFYSADSGETWHPLVLDLTGTQFEWDPTQMVSSDQYLIRILASDGVNSAEDTSDDTFTVVSGVPQSQLPTTSIIIVIVAIAIIAIIAFYLKKKRKG